MIPLQTNLFDENNSTFCDVLLKTWMAVTCTKYVLFLFLHNGYSWKRLGIARYKGGPAAIPAVQHFAAIAIVNATLGRRRLGALFPAAAADITITAAATLHL
jgi:hypothetical protein